MWRTVFFAICMLAANWAIAEDILPAQQKPQPFPDPPSAAAASAMTQQALSAGERAKHLRLAAAELVAAGMEEDAARFLRMADAANPASKLENHSQVLLHLTLLEYSPAKLRRLGFDVSSLPPTDPSNSITQGLSTPDIKLVSAKAAHLPAFTFGTLKQDDKFFSIIEALREDNLAKLIAEPTLVTLNGREASFSTGGEIEMPAVKPDGSMGKEMKKYGTKINLVPMVLDRDTIRLEIKAKIGELDYQHSVRIGKELFPGIRTREIHTAVESKSGQVVVLCYSATKNAVEVPGSAVKEKPSDKSDAKVDPTKEGAEETKLLILIKVETIVPMKFQVTER
jgi:Flp pilus assembly secretin CpaC